MLVLSFRNFFLLLHLGFFLLSLEVELGCLLLWLRARVVRRAFLV